jgi:hypothetical protein
MAKQEKWQCDQMNKIDSLRVEYMVLDDWGEKGKPTIFQFSFLRFVNRIPPVLSVCAHELRGEVSTILQDCVYYISFTMFYS